MPELWWRTGHQAAKTGRGAGDQPWLNPAGVQAPGLRGSLMRLRRFIRGGALALACLTAHAKFRDVTVTAARWRAGWNYLP